MSSNGTEREALASEPPTAEDDVDAGYAPHAVPAGPDFFFRTDMPAWKYIVRMAVVSFVPAAALALVLAGTGALTEENAPQFAGPPMVQLINIVIVAPLIETLLMALILWLLNLAIAQPVWLALASCIVWGALHSLAAPLWGLVVAWPFFVFSSAYLAWRRVSWLKAVLVAASIHGLHNLLPAIVAMIGAV